MALRRSINPGQAAIFELRGKFSARIFPAVHPSPILSIAGQAGGGTTSVASSQTAACGFSPVQPFQPDYVHRANAPPPADSRWPASPFYFVQDRILTIAPSRQPTRAETFHPPAN